MIRSNEILDFFFNLLADLDFMDLKGYYYINTLDSNIHIFYIFKLYKLRIIQKNTMFPSFYASIKVYKIVHDSFLMTIEVKISWDKI